MRALKYLTNKDFDADSLKLDGLTIVECLNMTCGSSQIMQTVIDKLKKSSLKFTYCKIDLQKYPFIIQKFYVLKIPTFLIFKNGILMDRIEGISSFNDFSRRINKTAQD